MRNVHNAFADVAAMYRNKSIEYDVISEIPEENRWIVNVRNKNVPESLLQIEVIDDDGIPVCCVLQKINVGRMSMCRFMDALVDALDE